MWNRVCIYIDIAHFCYIPYGAASKVVFQNRQVMITSLGCCCSYSRGAPQSLNCWGYCTVWGMMGEGGMEDDRGTVMKDECVVRT